MPTVIVIVDDEEAIADLVGDVLLDLGYQPVIAFNGKDALQVLNTLPEPPALVLSDIMMPFVDGIELARQIKQRAGWADVPVILMSAVRQVSAPPHIDGFVAKPFDIDKLVELIMACLGDSSDQPDSEVKPSE